MVQTPEKYDVVIIGGGPAGMAAALWCVDLRLSSVVIEAEPELGGQLLRTHNPITNYPGLVTTNGTELRNIFARQLNGKGLHARCSANVVAINAIERKIILADGSVILGRAVIVATGVRRRRLGIAGEAEFAGRGILDSGVASRDEVGGKNVVIVGGGDAAFENALILGESSRSVTLLHRSGKFSARREFVSRALQHPKISIVERVRLTKIEGGDSIASIEYTDLETGVINSIAADALLLRIGVEPNSAIVASEVELDKGGYIVTNKMCMTSLPFVFAIGDVADPGAPTISGAAGDAATAVKAAYRLLKASKTL